MNIKWMIGSKNNIKAVAEVLNTHAKLRARKLGISEF